MDEDFDFDDGGGSPEDYGMTQADFDAATGIGQAAYDQPTEESYDDSTFVTAPSGPSYVMGSENLPTYPGTNITDYSSINMDLDPMPGGYRGDPAMYTLMRGATATNPFPDSIFSKFFGAENVDYSQMPGFGGIRRVQEINDLRYRQAMGLPSLKKGKGSYTDRDFYIGQPTLMGEVKPLDEGIGGLLRNILPFGIGNLIPARGLPENDPRFIAAKERGEADPSSFSLEGIKQLLNRINPFAPTQGGEVTSDFPQGYNLVPTNRFSQDFGVTRPIDRTSSGEDGGDVYSEGILSIAPSRAREATESMIDREQLIPRELDLTSVPVTRELLSQNISPNFPMEGQRPEDLTAYFQEQNRKFADEIARAQLGV